MRQREGAHLAKASRITLHDPARVLALTAEGDPLIVLFEHPDRQCLVLAFPMFHQVFVGKKFRG